MAEREKELITMLGDTCFDAVESIEHYQKNFPQFYDRMKPEIDEVKEKLRALQQKLDAPDSPEWVKNFPPKRRTGRRRH